jgi:pimeloyl-ACP methyl ester carboxylesterase
MRGVARTAERLLDALGLDVVDVFGVSLSGIVAQQFANQAPSRMRRLVLAATGPGVGGLPGSPRALWALATPRRYKQPDRYRRIAGAVDGGAARRDPDALLPSQVHAPADHARLRDAAVLHRRLEEHAVAVSTAPINVRPRA